MDPRLDMPRQAAKWVECYGLAEAQRRAHNMKDRAERKWALDALRQYELRDSLTPEVTPSPDME